jgi:hypothetical protein
MSFFLFLFITGVYFGIRGTPNIENTKNYSAYEQSKIIITIFYVVILVAVQYSLNVYEIGKMCEGNLTDNLGNIFYITVVPWVLIYGIAVIALVMFPGFKTAFSNVIGYWYISEKANEILSELLNNNEQTDIAASTASPNSVDKNAIEKAANAIVKICGNTSILINNITPSNFKEYTDTLKPLMQDKYKNYDNPIFVQLLELVVARDNIGEFMWYLYSAILVCSIVQYNVANMECKLKV